MPRKKKEESLFETFSLDLEPETKRSIAAVITGTIALLFILSFLGQAGIVGTFLNEKFAGLIFGWGKWMFPFVLLSITYILLRPSASFMTASIVGISLAFLSLLGLTHSVLYSPEQFWEMGKGARGGGVLGALLASLLVKYTGLLASTLILSAVLFVGLFVAFNVSLFPLIQKISKAKRSFKQNKKKQKKAANEDEGEEIEEIVSEVDAIDDDLEEDEDVPEDSVEDLSGETDEGIEKAPPSDEDVVAENIRNIRFDKDDTKQKQKEVVEDNYDEELDDFEEELEHEQGEEKHHQQTSDFEWKLPTLSLLERGGSKAKAGNTKEQAEIIQSTLAQFGIDVEPVECRVGPTVTQHSFRPAPGVRLEKILSLNNNLAMSLAAHPIRIEAPIPGKPLIGIEVPNHGQETVRLRNVLNSKEFKDGAESPLRMVFGKNVSGELIFGDLSKMPHLLVAGATGTGKSVCVNSLILSLLYQNSPEDLKLALVDPKKVELSFYEGIPHLVAPVITENKKAVSVLRWAVHEMDRRYELLQSYAVRNIVSYNQKIADLERLGKATEDDVKLSYIVIVIDELADLMSTNGKDVEGAIVRLAQMARAVGIHLIVSTQRPDVKVLTGLIKANITSRVALKVVTQIDSRTILDKGGAEKLLGKGDMLYMSSSNPAPVRLQGVFISDNEVTSVVEFWKKQGKRYAREVGEDLEDTFESEEEKKKSPASIATSGALDLDSFSEMDGRDQHYHDARRLVIEKQKASTSFIQRALRIGYNHAARIVEELEDDGIVGPANGSKPREVLVPPSQSGETSSQTGYEDPLEDQVRRDTWQ